MKLIPITDVCDFQGGTQPPKREWSDHAQAGYIRMLQIRDFTQSERTRPEYVKETKNLKQCLADDVLIGRYGASVGKILKGLSGAYNVAIVKSIPDETRLSKEFIFYILKGPSFQNFILNVGGRAAQAGFNKSDLEKFKIPLLPPSDQKRIALLLGKVEELIAQRKQHLQQLDDLLKSVFLDMFGEYLEDEAGYIPITEISDFIDYRGKTPPKIEVGVPLISAKCVRSGYFDERRLDYISEVTYKEVMTRGVPKPNDVLFTTEGATFGYTCRIPRKFKRFAIGQRLICMVCKNGNQPEVLEFLLNNSHIQKKLSNRLSGSAVLGIRASELVKVELPSPPLPKQKQFAVIVEKIEAIKYHYKKSLNDLESLYGALSQKAFKGELDLTQIPLPEESAKLPEDDFVTPAGSEQEAPAEPKEATVEPKISAHAFTHLDNASFSDPERRKKHLSLWFKEWLAQYPPDAELSLEHFWQRAQRTVLDFIEEEDNAIGFPVMDYDQIKDEVFKAIEKGEIEQITNAIFIDGQQASGNKIHLRKLG